MALLSINQRKLLIFLANAPNTTKLFSKELIQQTNLSQSSIQAAIETLKEKDYIYLDKCNAYKILDPLIKDVLSYTHLT